MQPKELEMPRKILETPSMPVPKVKAYSNATEGGGLVFLAGQKGDNPDDDIREQTRKTMENIKSLLADVGLTLSDVTMCHIFIYDRRMCFDGYNEVYGEYFPEGDRPARITVETGYKLAGNMLIEITTIAAR